MPDEDDSQVATPPVVPPTDNAASVFAETLRQERERFEQEKQDLIEARDQEWRDHLAEQNQDDPPAPEPIDANQLKVAAASDAVKLVTAVNATREAVLKDVAIFGDEGVKRAQEIFAQADPIALANPKNANLIAGAVFKDMYDRGIMPSSGPDASNNGVQSSVPKVDSAFLSAMEMFGAGGELTPEEAAQLKAVGL